MSDRINLLRRAENLDIAPEFDGVSKLICNIDDETQMVVGDDSGYAIEFDNPIMTKPILESMLEKARGFQYQPYTANGALLDPAAEIGDAVSVRDIYGGIYSRSRTFSKLMTADISAPADEEIDHEYKYETKQERKVKRQFGDVRATLSVQAGMIEARVTKTGGDNSSFGWVLNENSHTWYSGSSEVMRVNADGLEIRGKVTATSGYIGNGSAGFTISARAIYNGMTSLSDTEHNGVYIGVDGIALGKGNFKVDSSGNLYANNGTFNGKVRAGSIQYGGNNGTMNANGLTDNSIGSSKYGTGSVNNAAIGGGQVSYGKTSFTGTLDQVGVNKSNIEAIQSMFLGTLYAHRVEADYISASDGFNFLRNGVGITVIDGHGCLTIY